MPELFTPGRVADEGVGASSKRDHPEGASGHRNHGALHRGKAYWRADQAPSPEKVDGPGRTWKAYRSLRQFSLATEPHAMFRVPRRKERVRLPQTGVEDPTYFFESLGYMVPDRHMDPYFAEFIPLAQHQELKPHMHPGFEFLYVLEGELGLQHGEHQSTLGPG